MSTLEQRRDTIVAITRIRQIIEANRNPRIMSHDAFDAWLCSPKANLFKRRAAEVLHTMRVMRLIGQNPGWEVARQMPRMNEFLKLAREAKDVRLLIAA